MSTNEEKEDSMRSAINELREVFEAKQLECPPEWECRALAAESERDRLRNALLEYAQHKKNCIKQIHNWRECDCGLREALHTEEPHV